MRQHAVQAGGVQDDRGVKGRVRGDGVAQGLGAGQAAEPRGERVRVEVEDLLAQGLQRAAQGELAADTIGIRITMRTEKEFRIPLNSPLNGLPQVHALLSGWRQSCPE